MADKLIKIPNDENKFTPPVGYNQWLKRFDTQLNDPTNSIQARKVVKPMNKKSYYKTLGNIAINSPTSPPPKNKTSLPQ